MRYRKLGRTNFEISDIGYGAWGIGGKQWLGGSDDESLSALRTAIDCGLNFIDTALAYGEGHSEQLVGKIVRESGRHIYVATKVPPKNGIWPAAPGTPIQDVFPKKYIIESTETSLRNLGLEAIDLQQLHVWTSDWTAREEWREAAQELKQAGKIKAFGISLTEHDPDSGLDVIRTGLIDAVQVIYNIFDQAPERNLLPLCRELNVGVLARVPLDEGGLTGRITEQTQFEPTDFRAHYFRGDRKKQIVERVAALRRDLGDADLAETALRYCLSHPAVTTVIPGMRSVRNAKANCAASDKGPLDAKTLETVKQHAWDRNFYE
ncbi:MAG TPA: aldo/keto reductase [Bryobacteraceae bacterium]|nr:aldo/keto reductase [Bryobacteraceae bacterium]